jgi:site-specific recombinase XerD
LRALIVLLWRAGLRISEALTLQESDLDRSRGAVLVRRGPNKSEYSENLPVPGS